MGDVKFSNNAVTVLSGAVSAGAISMLVTSVVNFPALPVGAGDWMHVTVGNEVVKVNEISGNTFNCDPLLSGHNDGDAVELRMTKETLDDFSSDVETDEKVSLIYPLLAGTNLLINPTFAINQRKYVDYEYVDPDGFGPDMWRNSNNILSIKLYVNPNGEITLTGSNYSGIKQINDDIKALPDGTVLTLSGDHVSGGTLAISGLGYDGSYSTSPGKFSHTFTKNGTDNDGYLIFSKLTEDVVFRDIKLEIGSVVTKYEIPSITEEELKCYRYFVPADYASFMGASTSGDTLRVVYTLPVVMSRLPSVNNANGFTVYNGNQSAGSITSASSMAGRTIVVYITSGSLFPGSGYVGYFNASDDIFFDAS